MIYVCLDSCIFNRVVTQGQPGSTMECFEELKRLAQEGKIGVIVPEVVVLEFDKFCGGLDNDFSASIDKLKKEVVDACAKKQWNEIDDLKQSLVPHIEAEAAKKKAAFPGRIKAVNDWLNSEAVVRVPFDSEIWLKAKRRLMSGRMPPSESKNKDQDASIVESVVKVLPKGPELYFCSENIKDFAVEVPNKGLALHPLLAGDLPNTKYFADLCSLVEAIKSGKAPPEPSAEEVNKAVHEVAVRNQMVMDQSGRFTLSPNARPLTINVYCGPAWLGKATFYKTPLETPKDFSCTPPTLISFDDAKQIALKLAYGFVMGHFGADDEYAWRDD
jgi:hypothetical protein